MDRLGDKICNKRMGDDNLKAPSEKQIKLADKIAYTLDLEFPRGSFDFTSFAYWKFINENMENYKHACEESRLNNFDDDIWWGYDLGFWEF